MERVQKYFLWTLIATETTHVFCCVLPTVFSIVSLFAGLGLVTAMPPVLENLHGMIHEWEIPLITLSGVVMLFGWLVYFISKKLDCHNTGCVHEPCGPKKKKAHTILKFATLLFIANISVYLLFHQGLASGEFQQNPAVEVHDHAGHSAH